MAFNLRENSGTSHFVAKLLLEELSRLGVRHICFSAGNQNSAFALALSENTSLEAHVLKDERAAAYFALGIGKALGMPAALICTSGTAVANYFPAVAEASLSATPMLILSADRPEELQQTGANQSFKQMACFGSELRESYNITVSESLKPEAALTALDHAVALSSHINPGPVQLNVAFRKPFSGAEPFIPESSPLLDAWGKGRDAYTKYLSSLPQLGQRELRALISKLRSAKNGLLVVGALSTKEDFDTIAAFAAKLNWPVYAGVESGFRFGKHLAEHGISVLAHSSLYAEAEKMAEHNFDVILELGLNSVKPGNAFVRMLEASEAYRILCDERPTRLDPVHSVSERIVLSPSELALSLLEELPESTVQTRSSEFFETAEQLSAEKLSETDDKLSELSVVRKVFEKADPEQVLFVSNSLSIRLAESAAASRSELISMAVNRGLSGIDGNLATAAGHAAAAPRTKKFTAILGDLALFHDLNSLAIPAEQGLGATLVVLQNGGGAIFNAVDSSFEKQEDFNKYMLAKHEYSFEHAAKMFAYSYKRIESIEALEASLSEAFANESNTLLEVVCPEEAGAHSLKELRASIQKALV